MNSSPPPPSFTLPPLTSKGKLPVTPSPTPSPTDEQPGFRLSRDKGKGKAVDEDEGYGNVGRVSMYVRLFDEMITTVLESESYLFTPREIFVLRYILALPYEPHYLLTRLLLRRQGKIHPLSNLVISYSPELGEAGVKQALEELARPLVIPPEIIDAELPIPDLAPIPTIRHSTPLRATRSYPTPISNIKTKTPAKPPEKPVRKSSKDKPWASLLTGLSSEEEKADPALAEAIRESLWSAQVSRIEIDDEVSVVPSPPPDTPKPRFSSRSPSSLSTSSQSSSDVSKLAHQPFSLTPREPERITTLSHDISMMNLRDLMSPIPADELRKLARARKVPLSSLKDRESVVTSLLNLATKQTTLGFVITPKSTPRFSTPRPTSSSLLISSLLPLLGGSALQIPPSLHTLISRLNLLYSRTPPLSSTVSSLLLPSILVTSHKRRYPDYGPPTRSRIWENREDFLVWERAVGWELVVGDALGDNWKDVMANKGGGWGGGAKEMLGRKEGAEVVRGIWEGVWGVWKGMVGEGYDQGDGGRVWDRFKTGHVLTRIVYKGAQALGILHEYDLECEVLRSLLAQRRWRRGKRGAWYERLALVLMNHYNATPVEKEEKLRDATQVCIDGLLDEDTHLIFRPSLSRRLTRLERKLALPPDECHISHASLNKSLTRELTAPRIPENMGQPKPRRSDSSRDKDREASLGLGEDEKEAAGGGMMQTGKSVWVGREGEVTVEGWVLEWWEDQGYKGYHSESTILTTLFTLLMWPVLFAPHPGAFETPYQTAPLDLGEDTFASTRREAFERRLEEISDTERALECLKEVDEREREKGTWAVGVNWEFGREDLREVVVCLGGKGLSGVGRMLGEEYRYRVGGVPDLLVWNLEKKEARFVEVKGPGDSLSETQKIWIDVLLSSGIPVEVCRVKSREPTNKELVRVGRMRDETRGLKRKVDDEGLEVMNDEEEEEEEDEMKYESGEEGKGEGHWERDEGKKVKR